MPAKLSKLNQSVEKALQIIEIMMKEPEAMRLQDIALKAEMPPSTALRMINTLLVYGYVNQDPDTLRYSLSLKFAQVGSAVSSRFSLSKIAHPLLVELSQRYAALLLHPCAFQKRSKIRCVSWRFRRRTVFATFPMGLPSS